jgi:hypothetical protein
VIGFYSVRTHFVLWALVTALLATSAEAYPWMVRHNYASCAACHVDPSGAGQLTQYGRAQADVLLRWKPGQQKADAEGEIPKTANFLWFLELPEAVNLSGNFRGGGLFNLAPRASAIPLLMAADLIGTFNVDRFVFHGSTGLGIKNTSEAAILPQCTLGSCGASWVAREFWAGAKFADESVMVRLGRMPLPFGLRNNEHNSWVRNLTRTDINLDQSVGVSLAYNTEKLRGEVMGILGNFQIGPDAFRERGYSVFGEFTLAEKLFVGLSSQMVWAGASDEAGGPTARHAHGLFGRWSPVPLVALMAELDLIARSQAPELDKIGFAGLLQADFEPTQGIHVMGTIEGKHEGRAEQGPSLGFWATFAWYFLPHVELRVDALVRRLTAAGVPPTGTFSIIAQLHFFL